MCDLRDLPLDKFWAMRSARSVGWWVGVQFGAYGVREDVVEAAVGVDGPEHGPDHAGVAFGGEELVGGSGGSFAGDDVVP